MHGMQGDKLADLIKESRPHLPIIMVTAFAEDFMAGGRQTVKADLGMGKPFIFESTARRG